VPPLISIGNSDGRADLVYFHGRGSREDEVHAIAEAFHGVRIHAYRGQLA
jgi:hypothetical protein